ncbi:hypothetical protein ST201phi2-1p231 [Pseudomonas phage 201phi2-1]|uniref:Uncharacterized protein n=1 Tax=Pseudomonas phage 201phi2-1 TaxID=198110 RepID=B3FJ93_BP201|nr:hypothetical protein ST201phi2-1p231 [Pseudomonas phage 201phi2-1]ABY63060.1 hypothetical protein 201phi2-1p231 [Pseudomonas phage 201phi2-1]
MQLKRILTPLDIHLDTRLGTINRINPAAAEAIINNKEYWLRENDFWDRLSGGLISNEEFAQAYAQRGGDNTQATLAGSIRTGIVPFILRLLTDDHINRLNQMADPLTSVGMTVNYWPYVLNSTELDWLEDIFHQLYGDSLTIELVSIPMTELTPQLMNENFAACVMYEFPEWIKMHKPELEKVKLNCFNFIAPKIFEQDVSETPIDQKQASLNAFRMLNLLHMDFEFIDSKYFSVMSVHGK